jgi:hypothetical protein
MSLPKSTASEEQLRLMIGPPPGRSDLSRSLCQQSSELTAAGTELGVS